LITAVTFDDISPTYLSSSQLKRIIEFFNELSIACTFFVVPDDNLLSASEEFKGLLEHAAVSGHELALHGYVHKKNEFGVLYPIPLPIPIPSLPNQKEKIVKAVMRMFNSVHAKPEGFRAPFYMHNGNTIKALKEAGLKYDSSVSVFKTTHCSSLRFRVPGEHGLSSRDGILEIPVTGDYTFNLANYGFSKSLRVALRDFDLMKTFNSVFVMNNHPNCLHNEGIQLLRVLTERIRKLTSFEKLRDVARFSHQIDCTKLGVGPNSTCRGDLK